MTIGLLSKNTQGLEPTDMWTAEQSSSHADLRVPRGGVEADVAGHEGIVEEVVALQMLVCVGSEFLLMVEHGHLDSL